MKRLIILMVLALLPLTGSAQAQIDTKKVKISDFTSKVTKVVLTGNMFYDSSLQSEIASKWHVSPFEFCTMQEFESLKKDDSYYFLLTVAGQFRKESEPGLTFLTLVKGGEKAGTGISNMLEIVSFPFASAEDPSGREYVFFSSILDIIQSHALASMERDIDGYTGLPNYTMNIYKSGDMTIVFSEGDLSSDVTGQVKNMYFDDKILVLEEERADKYMTPEHGNTLVSYVVAPTSAKVGSYCYKMLIDPQTSTLYYFRKHKISKKYGPGFLAEDIRRIATPRIKK